MVGIRRLLETTCNNSMFADLHRMYILFKRVPSTLAIVSDCMKSLVRQVGEAYVADPENKKVGCSIEFDAHVA